jgi:hypothetical protein
MTIKQMHIEFSQSAQKISAAQKRKALPDQIDWILNKVQERFLMSKVNMLPSGAIEVGDEDMYALSSLIRASTTAAEVDGDRVKGIFAGDHKFILSDESKLKDLCGAAVPDLVAGSRSLLFIPFANSAGTGSPLKYYTSISITAGDITTTLTEINTYYSSSFTGLLSADEKYVVVGLLLSYLREVKGLDVYWERYGNLYKPSTFIIRGQSAGSITVDGATAVVGTTSTYSYTYRAGGDKWVPNRLTTFSNRTTMQVTPFYKSSAITPISTLQGNYLYVDVSESFIVSEIRIFYIKQPRLMCLSLNQDCELPVDFHQTICDLAVEYYKAVIEDPSWEQKMADNMRRSPATQ